MVGFEIREQLAPRDALVQSDKAICFLCSSLVSEEKLVASSLACVAGKRGDPIRENNAYIDMYYEERSETPRIHVTTQAKSRSPCEKPLRPDVASLLQV